MKLKIPLLMGLLLCMASSVRSATLEVDGGKSRIQFDAKATGHAFGGKLEKFSAKGTGKDDTLAPLSFELTWNFKDLNTADSDRDAEMIKWLGGGKPGGSFKFVKFWTDKQGVTKAQGNLTIHGVTKTVSFPYTAKKDGSQVTIDGKVTLDYQEFDLPIVRAMLVMTVDPSVTVTFHIVGKAK